METMKERAAALVRNPHNLGIASLGGRMCNFDYARAIYEREGKRAPGRDECPYIAGTLAANAWQRGREFMAGMRLFGQGFPCPDPAINPAYAEGWEEQRADYNRQIEGRAA